MDKKERMMPKKAILLAVLFFSLLLSGCETAKAAGKGAAYGMASTIEGAGKDTYNFYKFIQAADNWIKRNFW
jgi:predicted small secreted protein